MKDFLAETICFERFSSRNYLHKQDAKKKILLVQDRCQGCSDLREHGSVTQSGGQLHHHSGEILELPHSCWSWNVTHWLEAPQMPHAGLLQSLKRSLQRKK